MNDMSAGDLTLFALVGIVAILLTITMGTRRN